MNWCVFVRNSGSGDETSLAIGKVVAEADNLYRELAAAVPHGSGTLLIFRTARGGDGLTSGQVAAAVRAGIEGARR